MSADSVTRTIEGRISASQKENAKGMFEFQQDLRREIRQELKGLKTGQRDTGIIISAFTYSPEQRRLIKELNNPDTTRAERDDLLQALKTNVRESRTRGEPQPAAPLQPPERNVEMGNAAPIREVQMPPERNVEMGQAAPINEVQTPPERNVEMAPVIVGDTAVVPFSAAKQPGNLATKRALPAPEELSVSNDTALTLAPPPKLSRSEPMPGAIALPGMVPQLQLRDTPAMSSLRDGEYDETVGKRLRVDEEGSSVANLPRTKSP